MIQALLDRIRAFEPGPLTAAERAALTVRWSRDAQDEHASVASFARFSLQLLAVGAPPDLLELAAAAAGDEVRHARLCFAVASRYAGSPLGPGALPLDGDVMGPRDLPGMLAETAVEGAIGETLAAARARAAAAAAGFPVVAAVCARIAEDESRHAELAWRTLAWGIAAGGEAARSAVADVFAGLQEPSPAPPEPLDEQLLRHGRLPAAAAAECDRRTLQQVLRPAAAALLG